MFGRREPLLLIAWVGLVSAVFWIAQACSPAPQDTTTIVRATTDAGGQIPALEVTNKAEHSPLVPRVATPPLGGAHFVPVTGVRNKQPAQVASGSHLPQTLQWQCVRWQI